MASEDDHLCYDLPSRTLVNIFSLYIHHPWNTWSTQVNIQYANLKHKKITQRFVIYCNQGSTAVMVRHIYILKDTCLLLVADKKIFAGVTMVEGKESQMALGKNYESKMGFL